MARIKTEDGTLIVNVDENICTVSDLVEYIKKKVSSDAPIKRLGLFLVTDEAYIILNNDNISGKINGGTYDGVTHLLKRKEKSSDE